VPGIDLAGTVVEGPGEGDDVLVHGYDLGVAHHGGYAEYARVPGDWVVRLPDGMSHEQAMAIGTAGFTAALAVARLERHGVQAGDGPVLVTGATGGVGSTAVSILAARGYEVVASTGKDAREYLESLGAAEIVSREDIAGDGKPLGKQRWAAAVDSVGGAVLAGLFPQIRYGGAVAATGLTAGIGVETTVMPFILRSVALLGVDSVQTPMDERAEIWKRLAGDLRPPQLDDAIAREISLDELEPALDTILKGGMTGRTVVRVGG
jgi:acrylyl-CoA reductase (NADPH)